MTISPERIERLDKAWYFGRPTFYREIADAWPEIRDALRAMHEPLHPREGDDEPCYYCGKICNGMAGNPREWPIPLTHEDAPGVVKWHHIGCVSDRLRARAEVPDDISDRAKAIRSRGGAFHHETADMLDSLSRRAAELEADAARYRWLRQFANLDCPQKVAPPGVCINMPQPNNCAHYPVLSDLDAEIDAEIAKAKT